MNEIQLLQTDIISRVIFCIADEYDEEDKLETYELERLCEDAEHHMRTMNGDAGQINITVRQFALLLRAAMGVPAPDSSAPHAQPCPCAWCRVAAENADHFSLINVK